MACFAADKFFSGLVKSCNTIHVVCRLLLTINLDYPPITLVRYLPTYKVVRPSRQMACGKTLNILSQEKRQATKIRATGSNMTCSRNARPDSIFLKCLACKIALKLAYNWRFFEIILFLFHSTFLHLCIIWPLEMIWFAWPITPHGNCSNMQGPKGRRD